MRGLDENERQRKLNTASSGLSLPLMLTDKCFGPHMIAQRLSGPGPQNSRRNKPASPGPFDQARSAVNIQEDKV